MSDNPGTRLRVAQARPRTGRLALLSAISGLLALLATPAVAAMALITPATAAVALLVLLEASALLAGMRARRIRAAQLALLLVVAALPGAALVSAYHQHQARTFGGAEVIEGQP